MNKKIILGAVLAVLAGWATLAYGQGNGLGQVITAEERAKLQSLSPEERMEYVKQLREKYNLSQGGAARSHSTEDLIADVPAGDIDDVERTFLINQYGEEKMARDLYTYAYEKYGLTTFKNIAESEQEHMDAIKVLLDRYNITPPSDYAADNDLYVQLKSQIDEGLKQAIEAGITVEMVDIRDIVNDIKSTDNDDIKIVLTRIGGASYNHLRGFVQALEQQGFETDLNRQDYLSEEELNSHGSLNYKLAEKLEAEGVELPQMATATYIKNSYANQQNRSGYQGATGAQRGLRWQRMNTSPYVNASKVNRYRALIKNKYQNRINQYSRDGLVNLVSKIDALEAKIQASTSYSETQKETYISVLEALKLVIQERLMELDGLQTDLIDSLFSN